MKKRDFFMLFGVSVIAGVVSHFLFEWLWGDPEDAYGEDEDYDEDCEDGSRCGDAEKQSQMEDCMVDVLMDDAYDNGFADAISGDGYYGNNPAACALQEELSEAQIETLCVKDDLELLREELDAARLRLAEYEGSGEDANSPVDPVTPAEEVAVDADAGADEVVADEEQNVGDALT